MGQDIVALIVTLLGVAAFAAVFTILYSKYTKSSIREVESGKRDIELIDQSISEKDEKVRKRKKAAGIAGNVLFYSIIAIALPLFAFAAWNKIQGNVMPFGDTALMVVASGSMSYKNETNASYLENPTLREQYNLDNQFKKFDMITIRKVNSFSDVKLYDVIAFWNPDAGEIYIHRVIDVKTASFVTRGDANNASDSYAPKFADIKGVYTSNKAEGLGMLVMFFQSSSGIVTVISVIYVLWMISHFSKKLENAEAARIKKLSAIIDDAPNAGATGASANYHETIYYQGYAYHFDENGFVEKRAADGTEDDKLVKVTSTSSGDKKQFISVDETPSDNQGDLREEDLTESSLGDLMEEDLELAKPSPSKDDDLTDLYDDE